MFSKEYIKFCIKNEKKLNWEPQEGDWCVTRCGKAYFLVRTVTDNAFYVRSGSHKVRLELTTDDVVWLPTPRQLMRMLEEKGYRWNVGVKTTHTKADKYRAAAFTDEEMTAYLIHTGESWSPTKAKIIWTGPDPETSLLKALMEVMKDE